MRAARMAAPLLVLLSVLMVGAAHAIDLSGPWWIHEDPYRGRTDLNFSNVTFDVVQNGTVLVISNVIAQDGFFSSPGFGGGTIDPVTGSFEATYGYHLLSEPILTRLEGTASADGTLIGRIVASSMAPVLRQTAVAGIRTDTPRSCGNSRLEIDESCDDGNVVSDDGCSATCVREPRCGDRIRDPGEDCDDGNRADGDYCSALCLREPRCGDGVPDPGEECDDGNSNEADRCSSDCRSLQECGNEIVEFSEGCDDGNTIDDDCCSNNCRPTSNVCRPSAAVCDATEFCRDGLCPADSGIFDTDADAVCNGDDRCRDMDTTRAFRPRSRIVLAHVNDDVSGNERLKLRVSFDLSPSTPFDDYDPTAGLTIIQIGAILEAFLPPTQYAGPGTRGWWRHPTRRQWLWRDKTDTPIEDILVASITATPTPAGDRVYVRVDGYARNQAFGLPEVVPTELLPLHSSITLGSSTYGQQGRCGQSRFTPASCRMDRRDTRIVCE